MKSIELPIVERVQDQTPIWRYTAVAFAWYALLGLAVSFLGQALGSRGDFGGEGHDGYIELARSVSNGIGFRFADQGPLVFHRPPLYVFLLVPVAWLPSLASQKVAVVVLNAAFASLLASSALVLVRSVSGRMVAQIAFALALLNPWIIWSVKNPMAAIAQAGLYTAFAMLVVLRGWAPPRELPATQNARTIKHGVQLGLSGLALSAIHATGLPIAIAGLLGLAVLGVIRRRRLLSWCAAMALAVVLAGITPWAVRNYRVTGRLIPVAGNAGAMFFAGNAYWALPRAPDFSGKSAPDTAVRFAGADEPCGDRCQYGGIVSPELDNWLSTKAAAYIEHEPGLLIQKLLLNMAGYFFPAVHPIWFGTPLSRENLAISAYFLVILVLATAGATLGRPIERWTALAAIAFYMGPYLPFITSVGHAQYTYGVVPFVSWLAAITVCRLVEGTSNPESEPT